MKSDGVTLLELLAVMAIIVIIFSISFPRINQSVREGNIRLIKSEMITLVYEVERLLLEDLTYSYDLGYDYQSFQIAGTNIVLNNDLFMQRLASNINELPSHFAYEIAVINNRYKVSVIYPGIETFKGIEPKEMFSRQWPEEGSSIQIVDSTGLTWEAFNNSSRQFGNNSIFVTLVELSKTVYDVAP